MGLRPLSRTDSAAPTSTLASPPTAWPPVITPLETCSACPMDWTQEQSVEWTPHRAMLVCVLLLMAVLMESVEPQPPPRQAPPQHQHQQLQHRLLPPPPPRLALPPDRSVGM